MEQMLVVRVEEPATTAGTIVFHNVYVGSKEAADGLVEYAASNGLSVSYDPLKGIGYNDLGAAKDYVNRAILAKRL